MLSTVHLMRNAGKVLWENDDLLTRNYFPTAAVDEIHLCCWRTAIWIVVYMIDFHPVMAK